MKEETVRVQKLIGDLATQTSRGFELVSVQKAETDRRMHQTEERMRQLDERMLQTAELMRQTDERFKRTDERIEKLVIAIGQFMSRSDAHPA